ncbi:MAG: hypothetical protein AMK70_11660 [Nitrospira bacterium SG8_35_1]|nr:MAG: hypothetical protein AMK70_11660 [Nitrospira bacterium SG8_35_1]
MKKMTVWNTAFFSFIMYLAFILCPLSSHALEVKRKVLDNGLVLLVVERHNLPVVKVSLGISAGSLNEPAEKAGLASLTASLLTEGTAKRTALQISEEIEFVGGDISASGGDDYVTAGLSVLKKDIALGFDLLSDIILHPVFPADEITKKIERTKAGIKSREENPQYVASREFNKAVFESHPYGRLVSGTDETLDTITRDDIVRYHSEYYKPNNSILSIVGDVTYEEAEALLSTYFSDWKRGEIRTQALSPIRPEKKKKTITVDRELTQATILLGHAGVSRDDPDYYALSVMNYILGGGGFASRLMQNIREEKGLVYDIHSYFSAEKYGGSFRIGLQTKNESANTAIAEILHEVQNIMSEPVTDTELADAQSFLTGSFPMRIETSSSIAAFLVAVEYYGLGMDYEDNYPSFINGITKEDITRVARKHLNPEDYVLVVVANQKETSLSEEFVK